MAEPRWRTYDAARTFVRRLGLLDTSEWSAYCRGDLEELFGRRPDDIPAGPRAVYGRAWVNWRDWLGPPPLNPIEAGFLPFKRARRFARSLKLASASEWERWCAGGVPGKPSRPGNVAERPAAMYPRAWRGWGDWLGTQRRRLRGYLPFDRARAWARSQGLQSADEWTELCTGRLPDAPELPAGIPASPGTVYRHAGWNGFGDWLGHGRVGATEKVFLPFEDARAIVLGLGFTSTGEYYAWSAGRLPGAPPRPAEIPGCPDVAYDGHGWTTWGDFLGTGNIHPTKREFRSFEAARTFARALAFQNNSEWFDFAAGRRPNLGDFPADVPKHPETVYADAGWSTWGDFLGNANRSSLNREFLTYAQARKYARSLGLRSCEAWAAIARDGLPSGGRLPDDIPHGPQTTYADRGWKGWGDFLGTGNRHADDREWLPFAQARAFARALGMRSADEWRAFVRDARRRNDANVPDVPADPARMYRGHGWRGWCDFLGVAKRGRPRTAWRPFVEARAFARGLAFRSSHEWVAWCRGDRPDLPTRPADIPAVPYLAYAADGWNGWRDFLGTGPAGAAKQR